MKTLLNIVYRPEYPEICLVDFFLPDSDSPAPLFVYLHGGGLEAGGAGELGGKDVVFAADLLQHPAGEGVRILDGDFAAPPGLAAGQSGQIVHRVPPFCTFADFMAVLGPPFHGGGMRCITAGFRRFAGGECGAAPQGSAILAARGSAAKAAGICRPPFSFKKKMRRGRWKRNFLILGFGAEHHWSR